MRTATFRGVAHGSLPLIKWNLLHLLPEWFFNYFDRFIGRAVDECFKKYSPAKFGVRIVQTPPKIELCHFSGPQFVMPLVSFVMLRELCNGDRTFCSGPDWCKISLTNAKNGALIKVRRYVRYDLAYFL